MGRQTAGARYTAFAIQADGSLDGATGDLFVTDRSGGAFAEPDNELVGNHGGPQTRALRQRRVWAQVAPEPEIGTLGGDPWPAEVRPRRLHA